MRNFIIKGALCVGVLFVWVVQVMVIWAWVS
jgi:hypothetical protein